MWVSGGKASTICTPHSDFPHSCTHTMNQLPLFTNSHWNAPFTRFNPLSFHLTYTHNRTPVTFIPFSTCLPTFHSFPSPISDFPQSTRQLLESAPPGTTQKGNIVYFQVQSIHLIHGSQETQSQYTIVSMYGKYTMHTCSGSMRLFL